MFFHVKNAIEALVLYSTIFQAIHIYECLRCYACSEPNQCGLLFSSNSSIVRRVESKGDGFLDVCTILVNSEGITTRNLILASDCHSSAYQFCCKEDWCNALPAPPLPALTTRICRIDRCLLNNNSCQTTSSIATLSSATESCTGTLAITDTEQVRTYKKNCVPGQYNNNSYEPTMSGQYFCCNDPECNQQSMAAKVAIQCYTCDSRITGLMGCDILDRTNPYLYESASSDPSEACAIIVGLKAQDPFTKTIYPAFIIRTFIRHCQNQSRGIISYGGATFPGRINCCWRNNCNVENLDVNLIGTTITKPTQSKEATHNLRRIAVIRVVVFFVFATIISIIFIVYQFRHKISQFVYRPLPSADVPLT